MIKHVNRLTINRSWIGKGIVLHFPIDDIPHPTCQEPECSVHELFIVVIPHDDLVGLVREHANYLNTSTWRNAGSYAVDRPNKIIRTHAELENTHDRVNQTFRASRSKPRAAA